MMGVCSRNHNIKANLLQMGCEDGSRKQRAQNHSQ